MEKKNEYHPHVRLGELYVVMDDVAEHKYNSRRWPGKVVRIIDGGVYGAGYHSTQLYFAPIDVPVGVKPECGHTGCGLIISPYIFDDWETIAKEMLG
jgi:hypothetical protein